MERGLPSHPTIYKKQKEMKKTIHKNLPHLIFFLLSLIFISPLPAGAVKKVEANPINVAVILTEKQDYASLASTLLYYGYQPSSESNSSHKAEDSRLKTEYYHHNGSVIRLLIHQSRQRQDLSRDRSDIQSHPKGKGSNPQEPQLPEERQHLRTPLHKPHDMLH